MGTCTTISGNKVILWLVEKESFVGKQEKFCHPCVPETKCRNGAVDALRTGSLHITHHCMPELVILRYMLVKSNWYVCPLLHCSGTREMLLNHGKFCLSMGKEGMRIWLFYVIGRHDLCLQLLVNSVLFIETYDSKSKSKHTMSFYYSHNLKMSAMSEDESVGTTRVPRPTSLFGCFCLRPKKEKYIY
jgi:hypothetical protein